MVIKFREDKIARLEQQQPQSAPEEVKALQTELGMAKESLAAIPQIARLCVENQALVKQLEETSCAGNSNNSAISQLLHEVKQQTLIANEMLQESFEKQGGKGSKNETELEQTKIECGEKLNEMSEEMARAREAATAEATNLHQTIDSLKSELEREREENRSFAEKLRQDAEAASRRHAEQMKEMVDHMDDFKSDNESELKKLQLEIIELQTANERLPAMEDEVLELKATLNIKSYDYEENIKELQDQLTNKKLAISDMQKDMEDRERELEKMRDRFTTQTDDLEVAQHQVTERNQACAQLKEELAGIRQHSQDYEGRLSEAKASLSDLEKLLETVKGENDALAASLKEAAQKSDKQAQEIVWHKTSIEQLGKVHEAKDLTNAELSDKLRLLDEEKN